MNTIIGNVFSAIMFIVKILLRFSLLIVFFYSIRAKMIDSTNEYDHRTNSSVGITSM